MGLSGRKIKQKIGADPRNLTWSDDSSKFGAKYLQSLGWSSGSGLGASGEGRTSAIKIHQKLDLMGIGANRREPGGDEAGWRGGREFEGLLARLNQAQNGQVEDASLDEAAAPENHPEGQDASQEVEADRKEAKRKRKEEKGDKRKRKREAVEEDEAKEAKRRRKAEKREKKAAGYAAKKEQCQGEGHVAMSVEVSELPIAVADSPVEVSQPAKVAPRYRAHRARNLASKRLASTSTKGMNEILGITSSTCSRNTLGVSSVPFPVQITPRRQPSAEDGRVENVSPTHALTRVNRRPEQSGNAGSDPISAMGLGIRSGFGGGLGFGGSKIEDDAQHTKENSGDDLLRKSGKSVAEYFAEKMRVKNTTKQAAFAVEPNTEKTEEPKRKKGRKEGK